jgi:hypothetical protein
MTGGSNSLASNDFPYPSCVIDSQPFELLVVLPSIKLLNVMIQKGHYVCFHEMKLEIPIQCQNDNLKKKTI